MPVDEPARVRPRLRLLCLTALLSAMSVGHHARGEDVFEDAFSGTDAKDYRQLGDVAVRRARGIRLRSFGNGGALVLKRRAFDASAGCSVQVDLQGPPRGDLAIWLGFAGETWGTRSGVRVAVGESAIAVSVRDAQSHKTLPPAWYAGLSGRRPRIEVSVVAGHTVSVGVDGRPQASFFVGRDVLPTGTIAIEPVGRATLSRLSVSSASSDMRPAFVVRRSLAVQEKPYFVTARDIDADGRHDLLVANRGTLERQRANTTISVLYGEEEGAFAPARHAVVGKGPYTVETGDVTGDGVPDVLVASFFEWAARNVTVLCGAALNHERKRRADQPASRALYFDSRSRFAALAVGNLRLDAARGYVMEFDLACMKGGSLYVWAALNATGLSDRTGALLRLALDRTVLFTREPGASWQEQSQPAATPIGPGDRVAVHVEGARLLVRVNGATRASFSCKRCFPRTSGRIPDGTVGWQVSGPRGEIGVDNFRLAALGGKQLVFEDRFDTRRPERYVDLGGNAQIVYRPALLNPSTDRTFLRVPATTPLLAKRSRWPRPGTTSLVVRDFDGDGALDVATVSWTSDALHVFRGDGAGRFTLHASYADDAYGHGMRDIRSGDVDGDGRLDLVVTCYSSNHVSVFQGRGDGTFRFRRRYPSHGTTPYHLALADLNGDRRLDIAVGNYSGEVHVLLNSGRRFAFRDGGTYRDFGTTARYQNEIRDVVAHDVDKDGVDDLLVACASPRSGYVSILYCTGVDRPGKMYGRVEQIYLGERPRSLFLQDFNTDGEVDLAVVRHDADDVLILDGTAARNRPSARGK